MAGDYTHSPKANTTISADEMRQHLDALVQVSDHIAKGLGNDFDETHSASSLDVTINTGVAIIDGGKAGDPDSDSSVTKTLTANETNHMWLKINSSEEAVLEVNTSGTAPSEPSVKLYEFTTDGSGVTSVTNRRDFEVTIEADLRADNVSADSLSDANNINLETSNPYAEWHDTDDGTQTRIRAKNGELQVIDVDSGNIQTQDLRNVTSSPDSVPLNADTDGDGSGSIPFQIDDTTAWEIQNDGDFVGSGDNDLSLPNQLILQGTSNYTIGWSSPSAARNYTIPDAGADTSFLFENRTLTGGHGIQSVGDLSADRTLAVDSTDLAGSFLSTGGASQALDVNLGDGLETDGSDNIQVDATAIAGAGLSEDGSGNLQANVDGGIQVNGSDNLEVVAGTALTQDTDGLSHADTSSQSDVSAASGAAITDIVLDEQGHVTSISTTDYSNRWVDETGDTITGLLTISQAEANDFLRVQDTTNSNDWDWRVASGGALVLNMDDGTTAADVLSVGTGRVVDFDNTPTVTGTEVWVDGNVVGGTDITVSAKTIDHADTSTQSDFSASAGAAITDVDVDGRGHVTSISETDFDGRYVNAAGDSDISGNLVPSTNDSHDLGSSGSRWNGVWCDFVDTGDIHLNDPYCHVCGEPNREDQPLVLVPHTVEEEGTDDAKLKTVPAHAYHFFDGGPTA